MSKKRQSVILADDFSDKKRLKNSSWDKGKGSAPALANPNKSNPNPNIVDQNKIKKKIRERPIRVKSVVSVFLFLICDPAVGWGHNGNTE